MRTWRQFTPFGGLLALIAIASPARANLIQNGDFAGGSGTDWTYQTTILTNLPGAQFVATPCSGCNPYTTFMSVQLAPGIFGWLDGEDLGWGTISQTFATTPGQTYRVSYVFGTTVENSSPGFFIAGFGGNAFLSPLAEVDTNTSGIGGPTFAPAPANFLQNAPAGCATYFCGIYYTNFDYTEVSPLYGLASFTAVADSSSTTLLFAGSCPGCDFIVTDVSVTPVPEPPTLAMFGLGFGLMGLGWRRRDRRVTRPVPNTRP